VDPRDESSLVGDVARQQQMGVDAASQMHMGPTLHHGCSSHF